MRSEGIFVNYRCHNKITQSRWFKQQKFISSQFWWASLVVQRVKNLPAVQKIRVWSLGWEDLLEKGMATHSSILTWRIPWSEEPGRLQVYGVEKSLTQWVFNSFTILEDRSPRLRCQSVWIFLRPFSSTCLLTLSSHGLSPVSVPPTRCLPMSKVPLLLRVVVRLDEVPH